MTSETAAFPRLLRLPEVQRLTGLSRSSIYERMGDGTFPQSVPLGSGSAVAWIESELRSWIAERIAARAAR
jgi:prophage regulatory protein